MSTSILSVIFLDNGGVLHDNALRSIEWGRLLGEYLSPRLGGDGVDWARANRAVFDEQWQRYEVWSEAHALDDTFVDFFKLDDEMYRWLAEMCEAVGVSVPERGESISLGITAQRFVRAHVKSGFPDAAPSVRAMFNAGYTLATASGEVSDELDRYMTALDIRACFKGRLYGPDLVEAPKASPRYYERILIDAGIDASAAVFVDDSERAVSWAAETGATVVHVCRNGKAAPAADYVIGSLLALLPLLREA